MAPKPQTKTPQRAQRFADGGSVGLQPSLAIGYADGGSLDQGGKGPWTGDLNSSTTTFNQDWLRGANMGDRNMADLINYAPDAANTPGTTATRTGTNMAPNPDNQNGTISWQQPQSEQNPDGSTNLDAQGNRIQQDASNAVNSPWASTLLNFMAPKAGLALALGKGAYDMYQGYNGLQPSTDSMATGAGRKISQWMGNTPADPAAVRMPGDTNTKQLTPDTSDGPFQPSIGSITQAEDKQPAIDAENARVAAEQQAAADAQAQQASLANPTPAAQADGVTGAAPAAGLDAGQPTATPAASPAAATPQPPAINALYDKMRSDRMAGESYYPTYTPQEMSLFNANGGEAGMARYFGMGAAGATGSSGGASKDNAYSFTGNQNGGDAGGVGGSMGNAPTTNTFSQSATAADGGMASPGGFQRAGQPGALPGAQPPGPPGLQMPGQDAPAPSNDPMHPAMAGLHVQNVLANPQAMQAMKTHIDQAIQSGQVNPQQLMMLGQLAQSALQHPELWPKLRQFAMQAGLPDAQQLPMQFSQQLCMAMLAASHAAQHGDRPGAFADGGKISGPGTGTSDSIPAHNTSTGQPLRVANGEYIIPADVVATKGKEFFDNIVRKYHTPAALQHGR